MTNTMNTAVEAMEHSYPLQIEKYAIRYGSGGKGKTAGRDGIIRSYRFLSAGQVSLLTERREIPPYGLQGGSSCRKGENLLIRQRKIKKIAGKTNLAAKPGDRLIIKTPGGGGWARPR